MIVDIDLGLNFKLTLRDATMARKVRSEKVLLGGIVALLVAVVVLLGLLGGVTVRTNRFKAQQLATTRFIDVTHLIHDDAFVTAKIAGLIRGEETEDVDLDALVREVVRDDPLESVGRREEWALKTGVGRKERTKARRSLD